jgi:hypothetical protein
MNLSRVAQRSVIRVLQAFLVVLMVVAATGCGGRGGGSPAAREAPTTVFGRQARDLAVGLAAQREGGKVDVTTTVLDQSGSGRRNLRVDLAAARGDWVSATPCGEGRYCADLPVAGAEPTVRVRLTRPGGGVSRFSIRLPRDPRPAQAASLVRASGAAVRGLHSLIIDERLSSGPPYPPLRTQFDYVAPDRLTYRIAGGGQSVVIGGRRWDRSGESGKWEESEQEPLQVPATDWRRVLHPSVLGSGMRDGRAVWRVSFYDPSVPAWFEGELDKQTNLPLSLSMTAAAHFMTHTFGAFNAPIAILPPA